MVVLRKISLSIFMLFLSMSLLAQSNGLKDIAPFPIGTAIAKAIYEDPAGGSVVINEFNRLTPEYQMKISTTNPNNKTAYGYTLADEIVNYANANGKQVHGHILIMPITLSSTNTPQWIKDMATRADSVEWELYMKDRIERLVNRYKAMGVKTWDVVGEAFLDNGNIDQDNVWYRMLGEGYIERAFEYAHAADPEAILFYNDYGHEYAPNKTAGIVAMANDFIARGIPIHGLGLQLHTTINATDANLRNAITAVAATGLQIHLSEVTVEINRDNTQTLATGPTAQRLQQQKQKYKEIVEAMLLIPEEQRFGLTFWGVTDKRSYPVRPKADWPVLWNDDFEKKQAYDGVIEGLQTLLSTMPVTCDAFKATAEKNGIALNWQTLSETNSKNYLLYRAEEGKDFSLLATVPSANQSAGNHYSYTDNNVSTGLNYYYQLRQEDIDGAVQNICNEVHATLQDFSGKALEIYPNPAKDKISLRLKPGISGKVKVQLFTSTGKIVYDKELHHNNGIIEINTIGLTSGYYTVKLIKNAETLTGRFVKED